MTSVTLTLSEELKGTMMSYSWINWSDIAREESMKKLVVENVRSFENVTDIELYKKVKNILSSMSPLPKKQQKARDQELKKIEKEKGISGVNDFLLQQFGLQ